MAKISVGDTIGTAYRFAFKQFFAVLGIIWFPYLVIIAIVAGLALAMMPGFTHALDQDAFLPAQVPGLIALGVLLFLGLFVAGAMVRVGLMRRALGMSSGWVFVYFSFGAPVWRMLGAMILAVFIIIGIVLASAAGVGIVWGISHALLSEKMTAVLTGIAAVVGVFGYFYSAVRLVFFLTPVVVAEEHLGLARSWALGRGNFWRIIIVMLASFIPVMIGFGILGFLVGAPFVMQHTEPASVHEAIRNMTRQMAAGFRPLLILLDIAYVTVLAGLGAGASAGAYLAVVPSNPGEDASSPAETSPV